MPLNFVITLIIPMFIPIENHIQAPEIAKSGVARDLINANVVNVTKVSIQFSQFKVQLGDYLKLLAYSQRDKTKNRCVTRTQKCQQQSKATTTNNWPHSN